MSDLRALVCVPTVPAFDRESGALRIEGHISFLLQAGWRVTLVARDHGPEEERYASALRQRGVATYVTSDRDFEEIVVAGHFDLALLAFWFIAEHWQLLLRQLSPTTRIVVDTIDLHFLRTARETFDGARGRARNVLDEEYALKMAREVNAYASADAVLCVSDKEAQLVNDLVGDRSLAWWVPDHEQIERSMVPFEERRGVVFVANFWHPPNSGALDYLIEEILPRIDRRLLAEHPIAVVGNGSREALRKRREVPHMQGVGWVPSVIPYIERARATAVPLRHGAGTKRKVIQSAMVGTPAVVTPIGAEGLPLRPDEDFLVADSADQFASDLERLLTDSTLWGQLADSARIRVEANHSSQVARQTFHAVVSTLLAGEPKEATLALVSAKIHRPDLYRENRRYDDLVTRLRDTVCQYTPARAVVAVVSKGDPFLVDLPEREGWHFPRNSDGLYAGHYPADAVEAISHLEKLSRGGAQFLVFPWTAVWWLSYYEGLARYLENTAELMVNRRGTCIVYRLGAQDAEAAFETPGREVFAGNQ